MEATVYVNTTTRTARAALTGSALPSVPVKLQTHLKLTVYFFATGEEAAALDDDTTFRVALKSKTEPSASVLWLLSAPTAENDDNYEFEAASVDSSALRTLIGDSASIEAVLEIEWTFAATKERVSIPVTIANAWIRTADVAPDFAPFEASITAGGFLRLVNSAGDVFHLGLNSGEPPAS